MQERRAELPAHGLRPGTVWPDWARITSSRTRAALLDILALYDPFKGPPAFTCDEDTVRQAILRHYLATGKAATPAALEKTVALPEAVIVSTLARLKERDLVVMDGAGGGIAGAYPFSDRATEHRVIIDGRDIRALCAIDALGAGAMARRDSVIRSACRECQSPIRIVTRADGTMVGAAEPPDPLVWIGRHYRDTCAASSLCTTICFFCSEAHLEDWTTARRHVDGIRLSLAEALEIGRALFEPALSDEAS